MNSLEIYKEAFITYLNEKIIVKEPVNLYEPIQYILQVGGKRLRPILTLMTCDLFNGDIEKAFDAALVIEVFHNSTLIHDDIIDSAPIRRGEKTVHVKWDENTGILAGGGMMILAYQYLDSYNEPIFKELITLFSKTALKVCEGQQLDINFENRNSVTIAEYIEMITYKTSVLVATAMKMGAIIGEANTTEAQKIYDFGLNLGIAFQLQDDYLDTFGNSKLFGKQIGGDIFENKKTFLYLKALEVCNDAEKETLLKLYSSNQHDKSKIKEVTQLFLNNNIDELIIAEIENYSNKAFEILETINTSIDKKLIFKKIGLSLMKRTI
jgi:geranylgeranyl diphosphate synthase type II